MTRFLPIAVLLGGLAANGSGKAEDVSGAASGFGGCAPVNTMSQKALVAIPRGGAFVDFPVTVRSGLGSAGDTRLQFGAGARGGAWPHRWGNWQLGFDMSGVLLAPLADGSPRVFVTPYTVELTGRGLIGYVVGGRKRLCPQNLRWQKQTPAGGRKRLCPQNLRWQKQTPAGGRKRLCPQNLRWQEQRGAAPPVGGRKRLCSQNLRWQKQTPVGGCGIAFVPYGFIGSVGQLTLVHLRTFAHNTFGFDGDLAAVLGPGLAVAAGRWLVRLDLGVGYGLRGLLWQTTLGIGMG